MLLAHKSRTKANINRIASFDALAPDVRRVGKTLKGLSPAELELAASDLRESAHGGQTKQDDLATRGLALAREAIYRALGIELYDVQLVASAALSAHCVVEMETGEGKTLAVATGAMVGALLGESVHVSTPNAYLAERDYEQLLPAFDALGISAGLLPESEVDDAKKRQAYACDITYGTGYDFGFDYLRDQLAIQSKSNEPLGTAMLTRLRGDSPVQTSIQRKHELAIVDEVDNVLLDDAGSPLVLSKDNTGPAEDSSACLLAQKVITSLQPGEHYHVSKGDEIRLTPECISAVHDSSVEVPMKELRRPWTEYIKQAIRAAVLFHRDGEYIVDSDAIKIVDRSTGRIFCDRSWSEGLHQAIEAKEGLPISKEQSVLAQVTRQRYYQLYAHLAGMTGTAVGCEAEFRRVYGMRVFKVARRVDSQRMLRPMRSFANAEAKWNAILEQTKSLHRESRPVLIGTKTIHESERIAELLEHQNIPFQLLNGKQDAAEAEIISQAGQSGAITIATNLAGRGTDIRLDDKAKASGGLHVIVSEPHELERIDRQLVGRCARQGDPGSAQAFLSAEDAFVQDHAPWLADPIVKTSDASSEVKLDLSKQITTVQRAIEKRQAHMRMMLMRQDRARNSLIRPAG